MKKQISPKIIALSFGVIVLLFGMGFYIFAWTEPPYGGSCTTPPCPPGGNVPAPINAGNTTQTKFGSFAIDGVALETHNNAYFATVSGDVGIGTTNPLAKLDVRGNVRIGSGSASANKALCWRSDNIVGYCLSTVDSSGGCDCIPIDGD